MKFQISKLCNETTHDKVAPTKQNLICNGKSAMEVIGSHPSQSQTLLEPPVVTFVQDRVGTDLVVILDNGPQMNSGENWAILRQGSFSQR